MKPAQRETKLVNYQRISDIVEQFKEPLITISDRIWELAETKFEEYESAGILTTELTRQGFQVNLGVGGLETAFIATYGSGSPTIAILGEFDALTGMSQRSDQSERVALKEGGSGHGCGHHLLGTGSLAGAIALKTYMEETGASGTIRYYGCPGEEGGSGKTFMVREGLFQEVDAVLTWHPGYNNSVMSSGSTANYQIRYKFKGKSAHSGISPHLGRSALDSVELMNVGANYLREHIIADGKFHYAITQTGGNSPNVVQAEAEVVYLIRAPKVQQVDEIYQRINDVAQGAALMTGTRVEIVFEKACSNLIPNNTLEKVMYRHFEELGTPSFTEAEQRAAHHIQLTLQDLEENGPSSQGVEKSPLVEILEPYQPVQAAMSGSTDVGDVSWNVPTAQCETVCYAEHTPFHSWQMVAQGRSAASHKGMLHAAKVIAATGAELLQRPDLIREAKKELEQRLAGERYVCPIPPGIQPYVANKSPRVNPGSNLT